MSTDRYSNRLHRRAGVSSLEVLVAFTLLGSVLAMATPLVVAHGRLLKAQRDYRLALDELTNQLEILTALPEPDLTQALEKLAPSALTAEKLPGVQLRAKLDEADLGKRLTLELWWDEPNRRAAPVRMAAWIAPPTTSPEE